MKMGHSQASIGGGCRYTFLLVNKRHQHRQYTLVCWVGGSGNWENLVLTCSASKRPHAAQGEVKYIGAVFGAVVSDAR